ncbi:PREDICTED: transforming growth factor beta receptor type 3-like [Cyprinodon variegatus]|uniref:transforming growth factor beta receptor type 3-like n=1 Tax=Cyprinodon variegatus TaxID=28743 RepID=UPI0007426BC2|nr:PREDICTED: transforming growth factor beta receptor type 3-like [Cyprinodon variegatus]
MEASNAVSVGSQTIRIKPKVSLPSGPQALIQWAEDNGYGPVTSYTSTPLASRFNIRLREQDVAYSPHKELPPEMSFQRRHIPGIENKSAPPRSSPPFPFPGPWSGVEDDLHESGPVKGPLDDALTVQCEEKRMVVSIERKILEENGFFNATLTLKDPACGAKVNATHYTLETSLDGCGTIEFPLWQNKLFINHVDVQAQGNENQTSQQQEGVSRSHMEQDPLKTEVNFNCSYAQKKPEVVPFPPRPPVSEVNFMMELSLSPSFDSPSQAIFPVKNNDQVFVQVITHFVSFLRSCC